MFEIAPCDNSSGLLLKEEKGSLFMLEVAQLHRPPRVVRNHSIECLTNTKRQQNRMPARMYTLRRCLKLNFVKFQLVLLFFLCEKLFVFLNWSLTNLNRPTAPGVPHTPFRWCMVHVITLIGEGVSLSSGKPIETNDCAI